MTEPLEQPPGLQRFPSGIAGLDRILSGGLFIGGNYLVMGPLGRVRPSWAINSAFTTSRPADVQSTSRSWLRRVVGC